jgi:hypothetical protein
MLKSTRPREVKMQIEFGLAGRINRRTTLTAAATLASAPALADVAVH